MQTDQGRADGRDDEAGLGEHERVAELVLEREGSEAADDGADGVRREHGEQRAPRAATDDGERDGRGGIGQSEGAALVGRVQLGVPGEQHGDGCDGGDGERCVGGTQRHGSRECEER